MSETINVLGQAQIATNADQVELDFSATATHKNYEEVYHRVNEKVSMIKSVINRNGLLGDDLKTQSFDVYVNSKSNQGQDTIFEAYTCTHRLKIIFALDMKTLPTLLNEISKTGVGFNIIFGISNRNMHQEKLMSMAVEDAHHKATILAKAAGVRLKEVESISYQRNDTARGGVMMRMAAGFEANPQAIVLSEQVQVSYKIGKLS